MAGNIIPLTKKSVETGKIQGVGGRPVNQPIGEISTVFYNESRDGIPRRDNLFSVRLLGQTGYIEMVKDIIKNQVASTEFSVKPDVERDEEPGRRELEAAKQIEYFFNGNFNDNNQSFDDLLKTILDDTLDMNSGITELVPDSEGYLDQIIARDGLTFTKNIQSNGLIPGADSNKPAYFQFSLSAQARNYLGRDRHGIDLRDPDMIQGLRARNVFKKETKKFGRNQIVWFGESPVSYNPYGRGRTQKVRSTAEILINGDMHRNRFFKDNEFHKGILGVNSQLTGEDLKAIRDKLDNSSGNEFEIPIVGGAENIDYIPIDPAPEKMQFLESHKWYTTLVLMQYGLNEAEAGNHENANLSVSEEMKFNVWRRTTQPLLKMIERKFNNEILPFLREYQAVDGRVKAEFEPHNRFLQKMENEVVEQELEMGTTTLNEARERVGREGFGPVGDLPQSVLSNLSQNVPDYVAEQMSEELEDVPSSGDSGGPGFFSYGDQKKEEGEDDGGEGSGNTVPGYAEVSNYREAFRQKDELLEFTKDALRNETGFRDVPGIVQHKNDLKNEVGPILESVKQQIKDGIRNGFPDEPVENGVLVNADNIVEDITLRQELGDVLQEYNLGAMSMSGEHFETEVEQETEKQFTVPDETKISLSFDLMDTFTADLIKQEALKSAVQVEDAVKDRIRKLLLKGASEGESIQQITERVSDAAKDMGENHAELVARTETLSSSRKGSQALAESTDLVDGKEWLATNDSRTREWHKVMDGQIVGKKDVFTVPSTGSKEQPSDYPRTARVVGEDQPFNCRCSQAPVLSEDMPGSVKQLKELDGVEVELGVTEKQFSVWKEYRESGETCFRDTWKRLNSQYNKSELVSMGVVGSRKTVYDWNDRVNLD